MRVITEEQLQNSIFTELQSIAIKGKGCHVGDYQQWCIRGEDLEQAIKNIFAENDIFKPTMDIEETKHGEWYLLDECANEGVYCSVCHKKVYKTEYANQKLKSKFCPNCGAKMDGGKTE